MRVILLVGSLEMGGAERQAVLLARELRQGHGVDARVWSLAPLDGPQDSLLVQTACRQHGVPLWVAPSPIRGAWPQWSRALDALARSLKEQRPDAILSYWIPANIAVGILWRCTSAGTFFWGQRDEGRERVPRWLEAVATAMTPWFISNSQVGADFLTQALGVTPRRVRKIHNGVAPMSQQDNRDTWRNRMTIPPGAFAVAMVANLHSYKDHSTLLRAWAHFLADLVRSGAGNTGAYLVLAGRRYDSQAGLLDLARQLTITDRVRFIGPTADVGGLLSAMDVLVHSSVTEGLPNAVLEAMQAGLPVIGTDIPGIREALGEGAAPFLAPPGDAPALATRLLEMYQRSAAARQFIGTANRERVNRCFAPARLAHEVLDAIVIGQRDARPWSAFGLVVSSCVVAKAIIMLWRLIRILVEARRLIRRTIARLPFFWRLARIFDRYQR